MKATLSLTVISAAMVLAIGAPSAFGDGRLAEAPQNKAVAYFHTNELATAATSALPASDAVVYFHANELATASTSALPAPEAVSYFRTNELRTAAVGASSSNVTATTSGDSSTERYVEAGALGIVVALGFGLLLVVRVRSTKPIAQ